MANSVQRIGRWATRFVALAVALLVSAYLVVSAQRQASRTAPAGAPEPSVAQPDNAVFGAPAPLVEPREAFLFSSKSMPVELDVAPSAGAVEGGVPPVPPVPLPEIDLERGVEPAYLPSSKFLSPLRAPTGNVPANTPSDDSAPKTP